MFFVLAKGKKEHSKVVFVIFCDVKLESGIQVEGLLENILLEIGKGGCFPKTKRQNMYLFVHTRVQKQILAEHYFVLFYLEIVCIFVFLPIFWKYESCRAIKFDWCQIGIIWQFQILLLRSLLHHKKILSKQKDFQFFSFSLVEFSGENIFKGLKCQ